MGSTPTPPGKAARRRASRAAGPASAGSAGSAAAGTTSIRLKETATDPARKARIAGPPPRRQAHRRLVAWSAFAAGLVAVVIVGVLLGVMVVQQDRVRAEQERNQRFVDTATSTVVNMFSFTQDSVEESVDQFVASTSGPLRDMMSINNNAENLKAMFRETSGSSEAVVNGAALERIDPVSNNASVLVSVRVTVSDLDGNNKPSQPYRMRVIVHEDDEGHMTSYDLKYPEGGN